MPLLEMLGVRKAFGSHDVLRGLDLSVNEHQVVCLIGPSGCGKSTLLRCINGLEGIQDGEIRLAGDRVSGPGVDIDRLRRNVGIVFQSFNLFPHMSVLENVTLAPICVLKQPRAVAEARAMALLKRIGLEAKARDYPDRLSGGQQQRVAIVRALAMDPKVMLLDEITSALAHFLAALERERLANEIELKRLTPAETGEMIRAIFNQKQVRNEFLDAIQTLTDGNPFFIEETLKSLVSSGDIYQEHGVGAAG